MIVQKDGNNVAFITINKTYLKGANDLQFYWYIFIVLLFQVCFGPSFVYLQGDFFENKNTVSIQMYLNHVTVLKNT